jgi:putative hydrolase of the HAD superfamily
MKIFFDVDGVLIDGWHANSALRKPWDATLHADLGIDRDAFQELFFRAPGGRSMSPMQECVIGRCDLRDALADVLPRVGYQGRVDDFMRYWFAKDSNVNVDVFGLVEEIGERSGAQMFVATGQEHHRARYLWNELGFSKHFDGIFYSADIGHPKKDVRFFEAINRSLGIGVSERPLFFDDQPEIVELANSAGWDATAFTSISDIREHPRLRHLWP